MSDAHMLLIEENVTVARTDLLKPARTILGFSRTSQESIFLVLRLFLSSFRPCGQSQQNGLKTDLRLPWRHRAMLSRFYQWVLDIFICVSFKNLSFKTSQKRMILCGCNEKISILHPGMSMPEPKSGSTSCGGTVLSPLIKWCFMRHLIACTLQGRRR